MEEEMYQDKKVRLTPFVGPSGAQVAFGDKARTESRSRSGTSVRPFKLALHKMVTFRGTGIKTLMDDEEVAAIWRGETEEFSASATVIPFESPLPLLRGPVPAGRTDDPSAGPLVLAFRDAAAWRSAFRATEVKIIEQCKAGSRVGCAISASNKCKPPWWKFLFGMTTIDYTEREQCEEREMAACLAAAKEACIQFAKDKCLHPFRAARIASGNLLSSNESIENKRADKKESEPTSLTQETSCSSLVTNYRGSDLLENAGAENSSLAISAS
ncbi:hypothetical protein Cni_G12618 [Canna indica]|uniref:Uncharacterized protein n=1 Tax=Canna indica TaxID=4628 RepID=A0AAQ3QCB3_9LILI|nr:hypothetical protein Cni_G12618 [Canna indica]